MKAHQKTTKTSAITVSVTSKKRKRTEERMAIREVSKVVMAANTAMIPAIPMERSAAVDLFIHNYQFKTQLNCSI